MRLTLRSGGKVTKWCTIQYSYKMFISTKYNPYTIRLNRVVLILLLLTAYSISVYAQSGKKILCLDARNKKPVPAAQLFAGGGAVANGYYDGEVNISYEVLQRYSSFILFSPGYIPDTLYAGNIPDTVLLHPLQTTLREAVISGKNTEPVLKSGIEYVVDYEFVGDDLLVTTFSGFNGKKAKLFILNNNGDTLEYANINVRPQELFKSCIGRYYVVTHDGMYPILSGSESNTLTLGDRMPLSELDLLRECILYKNDKYYYKFKDKEIFSVTFAYSRRDDTVFTPFKNSIDIKTFNASMEELSLIVAERDPKVAFSKTMNRKMWNNLTFKRMDVPLFEYEDHLMIFDFEHSTIQNFSLDGILMNERPILFQQGDILSIQVLHDEVTDRFYILSEKGTGQDITEIDVHHGVATNNYFKLEKDYTSKVRIRNNNIYYLWQNTNGATRQLYIQRNSIN